MCAVSVCLYSRSTGSFCLFAVQVLERLVKNSQIEEEEYK